MQQYELTDDHVKLIRQFSIWWDDGAYDGAPAVDCKRPFGNGDYVSDIAEIIGLEQIEADDGETFWPKGTRDRCEQLYRELAEALQVVLAAGSFEPGVYIASDYRRNWRRDTAEDRHND